MGEASVSDLYLGKYYLKELSAPVGYVLDPTEHEVDCTYEGATVATVKELLYVKKLSSSSHFRSLRQQTTEKPMQVFQGSWFFSMACQ